MSEDFMTDEQQDQLARETRETLVRIDERQRVTNEMLQRMQTRLDAVEKLHIDVHTLHGDVQGLKDADAARERQQAYTRRALYVAVLAGIINIGAVLIGMS